MLISLKLLRIQNQNQCTKQYPRTFLRFQVEHIVGITHNNITAIQRNIDNIIHNNKNKPFVYDIVQSTRDWIQKFLVEGKEQIQQQEQEKIIQQVFERSKYATYTRETQMNQAKRKRQMQLQQKLSGKQWFMKNKQIKQSEDQEEQESDLNRV